MVTQTTECKRVIAIRLNPGEDILKSLQAAVKENGVKNGFFLGGAGSVSKYRVHVVETTNLPPGDLFFKQEGPFDVLDVTGVVINGRVHAHIVFSDKEKASGGHLEEGCTVLTFAMIVLADTPEADLTDWDSIRSL
jgi:predicted DNA-binding protein with PD1-like motif